MHLRITYCFCLLLGLIPFLGSAQTAEYPWAISAGGSMINYRPHPGNPALHENLFDLGFEVAAQKYLNSAFDFRTQLLIAPAVRFPQGIMTRESSPLFDLQYRLSFKFNNGILLKESGFLGPFLSLGVGGSYARNHPDAYIPLGGGVRLRINPRMAFRMETTRKISVNKDYQNLSHAVAFIYNLNTSKQDVDLNPQEIDDIQQVAALIPRDIDRDGLVDHQDACPEVAGPIATNGCPTEDFTRPDPMVEVIDEAKLQGNPEIALEQVQDVPIIEDASLPNEDITIEEEEPTPILDEEVVVLDESPNPIEEQEDIIIIEEEEPGPSSYPKQETKYVAPADQADQSAVVIESESSPCNSESADSEVDPVFFTYGSDILEPQAYQQLDEIAAVLKSCNNSKLVLSGHTDDRGSADKNLVLSIKRAFNVKYYLVNHHSISQNRISSSGLGEDKPVADNKTSSGRGMNRRVDFLFVF